MYIFGKNKDIQIDLIQKYSRVIRPELINDSCNSCIPGVGLQHLSALLFYEHWRREWIQSGEVEQFERRRSRGVGGGELRGIFVRLSGCRVGRKQLLQHSSPALVQNKIATAALKADFFIVIINLSAKSMIVKTLAKQLC